MAANRLVTALAGAAIAAASSPASAQEAADGRTSADPRLRPTAVCIDKEIADRLALKRKRRGVVDRLFIKQARHELTVSGGYYVSDLFSSTYSFGGSYTYHMTETTAVEMSALLTHANAEVIAALEDDRTEVIEDEFAQIRFFESLLLWTPVYGKLRLGGAIARFDIHLDAGVGVVDSPTSRGASGVAGLGMKLFAGKAFAFRLDARDRVYRQELLDEGFWVNDLSVTLGLSLFLPMRN